MRKPKKLSRQWIMSVFWVGRLKGNERELHVSLEEVKSGQASQCGAFIEHPGRGVLMATMMYASSHLVLQQQDLPCTHKEQQLLLYCPIILSKHLLVQGV